MTEIRFTNTNPQTEQLQPDSQIIRRNKVKIETVFNNDGSKTEKVYNQNGDLNKLSVFKDVNKDVKEDIYSITRFYKDTNGLKTEETFMDLDGDGYNDIKIIKTYDENGRLKSETKTIEEDINEVKNRPHMDYEIYNRHMNAHSSGYYMM